MGKGRGRSDAGLGILLKRTLQLLARYGPRRHRVAIHRMRGVNVGDEVSVGYDVVLETGFPHLLSIGDGVAIGTRSVIVAHFRERHQVVIEDGASIGPGCIILPGTRIGRDASIGPGTVVSRNVPAGAAIAGNPPARVRPAKAG